MSIESYNWRRFFSKILWRGQTLSENRSRRCLDSGRGVCPLPKVPSKELAMSRQLVGLRV